MEDDLKQDIIELIEFLGGHNKIKRCYYCKSLFYVGFKHECVNERNYNFIEIEIAKPTK